jgi:hypothetical protein
MTQTSSSQTSYGGIPTVTTTIIRPVKARKQPWHAIPQLVKLSEMKTLFIKNWK